MSRIESGLPGSAGRPGARLDFQYSRTEFTGLAGWSSLGLDSMSRIESGLPGLPGGQGLDSIFSTHALSTEFTELGLSTGLVWASTQLTVFG